MLKTKRIYKLFSLCHIIRRYKLFIFITLRPKSHCLMSSVWSKTTLIAGSVWGEGNKKKHPHFTGMGVHPCVPCLHFHIPFRGHQVKTFCTQCIYNSLAIVRRLIDIFDTPFPNCCHVKKYLRFIIPLHWLRLHLIYPHPT